VASLATYINGYPFKPGDLGSEGVPVVRIKQLLDSTADFDYHNGLLPERYWLADGDLVFSWSGSLAVRQWDRGRAYLNQHLFRVQPTQGVDKRWLKYALEQSLGHFESMRNGSAGMSHITLPMLKEVLVPCPLLDEQRRIADFLDDQVARIDTVISARARQVALQDQGFTAWLHSEIFVPGRDGEFHYGWPSRQFRRVARKLNRPVPERSEVVTAFRDGFVGPRSLRREEGFTFSDLEQGYQGVQSGDFVFHGLDGFAGAFGVAVASGRCTPVYHVVDTGEAIADFIALVFRACASAGLIAVHVPSTRQRAVDFRNWQTLGDFEVPIAPWAEQEGLVAEARVRRETAEASADAFTRSIDLLNEYKRSLITAAVTGEFDMTTARTGVPA
jgi:type I restriction enzyme S subunit